MCDLIFTPNFFYFPFSHTHTHTPTYQILLLLLYRVLITLISLYSFICKSHHGMHERERGLYDSPCACVCVCFLVFVLHFCKCIFKRFVCLVFFCFQSRSFLSFFPLTFSIQICICFLFSLLRFVSFFLLFYHFLSHSSYIHPKRDAFFDLFRSEWFRFDCCGATNLCLCVCMCGFSKSISF